MKWIALALRMRYERDLSAQERMCLPTNDSFPSVPDHDAAFYRHALALSLRIQRPLVGLYHAAIAVLVLIATSALTWHFTRSWQVPPEATPGRARLRVGWAYACPGNYVQAMSPVILSLPDVLFTIDAAR